ncbi:MAG: ATP-binding cassette domain-containing protein [Mycobacteriales bacterium]
MDRHTRAPLVRFDNVTVVRGGTRILDHLTWTVREGERWVVLGPNGAGKTTLLEVAGARLAPLRGTVDLLGERVRASGREDDDDLAELRSRIGLVSQLLHEQFEPDAAVLDIVRIAGYGATQRRGEVFDEMDDERAMDVLGAFDATGLATRTYGTLSEGERKRVQLARAVMTDPELLLLDEPATALDLGAREELVGLLSDVAADPAAPATVLITHHVEDIPVGFTHALLLRGGRATASGRTADVLTDAGVSECFGVRVRIDESGGRFAARIVRR